MNENEMNFQYIECLDGEFLNFNFEIKEADENQSTKDP